MIDLLLPFATHLLSKAYTDRLALTGWASGVRGRKMYAPDAWNSDRELLPGKPMTSKIEESDARGRTGMTVTYLHTNTSLGCWRRHRILWLDWLYVEDCLVHRSRHVGAVKKYEEKVMIELNGILFPSAVLLDSLRYTPRFRWLWHPIAMEFVHLLERQLWQRDQRTIIDRVTNFLKIVGIKTQSWQISLENDLIFCHTGSTRDVEGWLRNRNELQGNRKFNWIIDNRIE